MFINQLNKLENRIVLFQLPSKMKLNLKDLLIIIANYRYWSKLSKYYLFLNRDNNVSEKSQQAIPDHAKISRTNAMPRNKLKKEYGSYFWF